MTATLMEAQSLQAVPVAPSPALESLTKIRMRKLPRKRRSVGSAKAKPAPKGKSQPTKKGQKENQELAKNLDVAEKYLASLQELKFHTLWKSVIRGPEIDRRLSRESSALNSMEASMGVCSDPELTAKGWKLCADTKHQAKAVFSMKEGCRTIRGAQVQELINEVLATGGSLAPMLSSNDFDLRKRLAADTSTLVDFLLVTAVEHTAMVLIQVWSPGPGLHGTFEGQAQDHPGGTCGYTH